MTSAPTTTTPAVPDVSLATSLFSTIASRSSATTATAAQFAEPGSAADEFVAHQAAVLGLIDAVEPARSTATEVGFRICGGESKCVDYTEISTDDASGRVTEFSIDGAPLSGRITSDGPLATFEGGSVNVTSAYRSTAPELTVIVSITNTSTVELKPFAFNATYQPSTASSSVETIGAWGPAAIDAGASEELLLVFPDQSFGGQIRFSALRSDGLDVVIEASLPVV